MTPSRILLPVAPGGSVIKLPSAERRAQSGGVRRSGVVPERLGDASSRILCITSAIGIKVPVKVRIMHNHEIVHDEAEASVCRRQYSVARCRTT